MTDTASEASTTARGELVTILGVIYEQFRGWIEDTLRNRPDEITDELPALTMLMNHVCTVRTGLIERKEAS